jgi:ADP-glucose pyrophosphorylase
MMKVLLISQQEHLQKNRLFNSLSLFELPIINIPFPIHCLKNFTRSFIAQIGIFGDFPSDIRTFLIQYYHLLVLNNSQEIMSFVDQPTLIVFSNMLVEINMSDMLTYHADHGKLLTMTMPVSDHKNFICLVDPVLLQKDPDFIPSLLKKDLNHIWNSPFNPIIYKPMGNIYSINTLKDYFTLNIQMLIDHRAEEYFVGENEFWVGENNRISEKSSFLKPVLIGNQCQVEDNSYIIGPSIIGNKVTISSGASLNECLVLDNTTIPNDITLDRVIAFKDDFISID